MFFFCNCISLTPLVMALYFTSVPEKGPRKQAHLWFLYGDRQKGVMKFLGSLEVCKETPSSLFFTWRISSVLQLQFSTAISFLVTVGTMVILTVYSGTNEEEIEETMICSWKLDIAFGSPICSAFNFVPTSWVEFSHTLHAPWSL